MRLVQSPEDRFMQMVSTEPMSGCWLWLGHSDKAGYGYFAITRSKNVMAHRWSYEHFIEPIPEGFEIHHKCGCPTCVNPRHLQALTSRQHMLTKPDSCCTLNALKTHCIHGHEFTPENTIIDKLGRKCKACVHATSRRLREKKANKKGRTVGLPHKERTHCPKGHEYTPENIYWTKGNGKGRGCLTCRRASALARYYAKRNSAL